MLSKQTDKEWEKFGKYSPYFGVLTEEKYSCSHDTKENLEEFFQSGVLHVDTVFQKIKQKIDPSFKPKSILDFGCGVGRLVIPFSSYADSVVGVDISKSMLAEAKLNCVEKSISNVSFLQSDDGLSSVDQKFDLIHSFIVFQHIPTKRGELIFARLLECLEKGGVCVAHFTYNKSGIKRKIAPFIKRYVPFSKYFVNLIKGRNIWTPQMEMNSYDLNKLLMLVQKNNVKQVYAEFTIHGGELGIVLYFAKN